MTNITASLVKSLREMTGAGMMECKKALVAVGGDLEKAQQELRKSGAIKADKKSGRIAAEGMVAIKINNQGQAIILEVNSETDFVARDDNFKSFVDSVVDVALAENITDVDILLATKVKGTAVEEMRQAVVAKLGENITVRRLKIVVADGGIIGHYVHGDRIGVLVVLDSGSMELAKDIAMHIAASRPIVVNPDDVPEDIYDKEREIYMAQAAQSNKPQDIMDKMVSGRMNKFLNEISLVGQAFVKDPEVKVGALLKQHKATVKSFVRFEVGEGMAKREDNFADEVMSQVHGEN